MTSIISTGVLKQVAYEEIRIEKDKMEDLVPLSGLAQTRANVQYENFCANGKQIFCEEYFIQNIEFSHLKKKIFNVYSNQSM